MIHTDPYIAELDRLFPAYGDTSSVVVSCMRADYSASRLARAVEDADAHLLNLNVLAPEGSDYTGRACIALRIDRADPSAVVRSLERYGYAVEDVSVPVDESLDSARDRVRELLRYLEV